MRLLTAPPDPQLGKKVHPEKSVTYFCFPNDMPELVILGNCDGISIFLIFLLFLMYVHIHERAAVPDLTVFK